jgi:hypothetical protein
LNVPFEAFEKKVMASVDQQRVKTLKVAWNDRYFVDLETSYAAGHYRTFQDESDLGEPYSPGGYIGGHSPTASSVSQLTLS